MILDSPDRWPLVADQPLIIVPHRHAPRVADLLDNDLFLLAAAGMCVFGVVGGLAVVASRAPARWMGQPRARLRDA